MSENLKIEIPTQGWRQFLTSRKKMLHAYDEARERASVRKVATQHGNVAEAELRKWLASFLPKRFAVTSGYIISLGLKDTQKSPHFDVIIYDHLESPILWVEGSPDVSEQGHSRAIPVEYVYAVIEVKARFLPSSVNEAIAHLEELIPLMRGPDAPNAKYKLYLPLNFCCGLVFFDLMKKQQFSRTALNKMVAGHRLRRFFGAVILRGEGHEKELTGRCSFLSSETPIQSSIGKAKDSLLCSALAKSERITDNLHYAAMLLWSESQFSQFAFDLIAMMQGTYEPGRLSSFYGFGTSP